MKIEDRIKQTILENKVIKEIINSLNLNKKQIESGYDIFLKIIDEQENLQNLEFITKVIIYDESNVIGVQVPNKKTFNSFKRNKYYVLKEISNVEESIKFANPKSTEISKPKDDIFYWVYPRLKNENNRSQLALWLKEFYSNRKNSKYTKGLYVHGKFGLGKTYFFYALTNYLIEREIFVSFININDLYEHLTRNMEKSNEINFEIVDKMKNVDFLLIDDLGSEKHSSWFLFTILYPIFEYRLKEQKTTMINSIFSYNELKKYWMKSKELDDIKVERVIDKIKGLTKEVCLKGKNIRDF